MSLNKGQRRLLALAAIFIVPVIAAYIMVGQLSGSGAIKTRNHGELITPPRPLQDVSMHTWQGDGFVLSDLRGKWVLAYLGAASCDTGCQQNLYKMRQGRLAQGGEYRRIERVYIVLEGKPGSELEAIAQKDHGLGILLVEADKIPNLRTQFGLDPAVSNHGIYLIDPLGNLMMHYPADFEAKGLAKDLTLLLKASYIG
jgi:cytochrome oxidase Cu insertion factor (SCO1/SenC/PrrC family)